MNYPELDVKRGAHGQDPEQTYPYSSTGLHQFLGEKKITIETTIYEYTYTTIFCIITLYIHF